MLAVTMTEVMIITFALKIEMRGLQSNGDDYDDDKTVKVLMLVTALTFNYS